MKMKKRMFVIIVTALICANSGLAYAETIPETSASTELDDAQLYASVDGITFEYDYSSSSDLVRVVKVKYDQKHYTSGINKFNAEISIPPEYVASVKYSSKLSGFIINDSYDNGVYKCSGSCPTDKIPSDRALFTMEITLNKKIANPFKIYLTGNSYLSDTTGVELNLSTGGMNNAELEIPKNLVYISDSGVDGAVTWEFINGALKLHGSGTMRDYEKGSTPWYIYADQITSIEFTEDRLQNISRNAFYGLNNVQTVTLSSDITAIDSSAFENCSSLKEIKIPLNSGVGISDYAFKNCSSLKSLNVPSGVRAIGRGAFEGCTGLESVTLPFIGAQKGSGSARNAFSYIFNGNVPSNLKTVTITDEINVPESAFEGCKYIENIYINPEITAIGTKAFKDCSKLKEFSIPAGVTDIADYTFQNCSAMNYIDITDNIRSIGTGAFDGCAQLVSVYVPDGITEIKNYTFRGCSSLTAVEIPNSVKSIGENVLTGCISLVDVKVPFVGANMEPDSTGVTYEGIFGYFFGGSNSAVPPSVTKVEITSTERAGYIPKEAFKNCGYIEDIIIYGGRSVLNNAFENCKNLKNLYIPNSMQNFGDTILAGCTKLETLTVPFIGMSRDDSNTATSVLGGFFGIDDEDKTGTLQYYNGIDYHFYKVPRTLKNVSVLNHTDIPQQAFANCDFIENISIVTGSKMGKRAFYRCASLKTVILPNNLKDIGYEAFAECESLEKINIPENVRTIGDNAFANDIALKNVTMPSSITEIADSIFDGVSVHSADDIQLMATDFVITCSEGSESHKFAVAKGIPVKLVSEDELNVKNIGANISALSTGEWLVDVTDTNKSVGRIYVALYDDSGRMLHAKEEKTMLGDLEYRITFSKEETQDASYAKVFVWGGIGGIEPLTSEVATLTDLPE